MENRGQRMIIDFGIMPTFIGTIDPLVPYQSDKFHRMLWGKHQNGTFGVIDLPDFEDIYINQHNEPVGNLWEEHHRRFAEFIMRQDSSCAKVLEIGPGSGALLAHLTLESQHFVYIDTIDPNPLQFRNSLGKNIRGSFPQDLTKERGYNKIIHSHLIEHVPDVIEFLKDCNQLLAVGDTINLSLPNMREMAKNLDLNMLMFEHVTFLPFEELSSLLEHCGFCITDTYTYFSHSIFVAATKVGKVLNSQYCSTISDSEFELLALKFRNTLTQFAQQANSFLSLEKSNNFLFGAHIFSQYLLGSGLDHNRVSYVLDNSELKNKKRLFGTRLICMRPTEVNFSQDSRIVMATGQYENEIMSGLKSILPKGAKVLSKKNGEISF